MEESKNKIPLWAVSIIILLILIIAILSFGFFKKESISGNVIEQNADNNLPIINDESKKCSVQIGQIITIK
ncbi:MAG: hypothetical protein AABX16_04030 [Nanoarchaeota archaeon]